VLLAAALRVAAAILLPDQNFADAAGYRSSGLQLWSTGQLGASHIMPLYPALVGLMGPGLGQLLLDIALSTLTVWLVHTLSSAIFADRLAAQLAALGCAIYPHFVFFSLVGLTETLFITLVVAAMAAWYRGAFVVAAVCAVLSILTRPAMDLLAPALVLYFALIVHRLPWRGAALKLVAYVLIYCAMMTPWWLHNYRAYGSFVRLNLGSGEVFYLGNNPLNRTGGGIYGVDGDLKPFEMPNPVARNATLWKAGMDHVLEHPGRFVEMAAIKFVRLWRPWPYTDQYQSRFYIVASVLSFGPVALLALFYLLRWGWHELPRIAPVILFVGYLTGIHMVTIGSVRYRVPMEPFVVIFAAVAAARLLRSHPGLRQYQAISKA
jgi:4-amino-4-deoxy-L-arabinose transferase-like glycosyltransferase